MWDTALAILARQAAEYLAAFWSPAQRGTFRVRLSLLRDLAQPGELVAFNLMDADLELVSMVMGTDQPSANLMPRWWKSAEWRRGSLADEEDGTLGIPALAELYSVGRHDFASGLTHNSHARAFAEAAEAASERSSKAAGHTTDTWAGVPACRRSRPARCSFTSLAAVRLNK